MLLNDRKRDEWNGLSFDEPSKAVIACDSDGHGCVLWTVGAHLRCEMEETGLSELGDLGLDDAPAGISIWEGKYFWQPGGWECPQDGEMFPKGVFRAPTDDEWLLIRAGRCPWTEIPCTCGADYEDCPTHTIGISRASS